AHRAARPGQPGTPGIKEPVMGDHEMKFDDERLTAYVLGELDAAECGEVEKAMERDEAVRARVDDIRSATGALHAAFAREKTNALDDARREHVLHAARQKPQPRVSVTRIAVYAAVAAAILFVALPAIRSLEPEDFETANRS